MTQDDLLYRFRLRVFAVAAELGNVRAACRAMGIHPSTYYRWKRQLDRHGPEILRPRERRVPRMANQTSVLVEQRVVGFALGHPGFGPARIAAELATERWGAIQLSTNGVWRVLRRHGLSTRAKRYGLVMGYAAPPAPERPAPPPERHLDVDHPGQLVQLDCFCIGRLSGTKGTVWQYTAIDVASAYTWATLQVTRRNPSAAWTSALARQVAADLAACGWKLERVMSDNASEFRSSVFQQSIAKLKAQHSMPRLRVSFLQHHQNAVAHTDQVLATEYLGRDRGNVADYQRLVGRVLEEQVAKAKASVLLATLTDADFTEARQHPSTVAARFGIDVLTLNRMLGGELDTVLAACVDHTNSPYTPTGEPCRASFLRCLDCPNARATPQHLPVQALALDALTARRAELPPLEWARRFALPHEQLSDLLGRFPPATVAAARAEATEADRQLVARFLARELDHT